MSDVRLSRETVEALHRYISIHLERTPEKWRLLAALDADLARAEALLSCPVVGCKTYELHDHCATLGTQEEKPDA